MQSTQPEYRLSTRSKTREQTTANISEEAQSTERSAGDDTRTKPNTDTKPTGPDFRIVKLKQDKTRRVKVKSRKNERRVRGEIQGLYLRINIFFYTNGTIKNKISQTSNKLQLDTESTQIHT